MSLPGRLALAAVLLAIPLPVLADEAADAFDKLYGEDLKRVAATPQAADDVALAKQMLEDAKKAGDQPAFLALLCEKAYELAARDQSGYATAIAAMDLLEGKVPEKKIVCLQKNAALYQKQYAAARSEARAKAGENLIKVLSALAEVQAAAGDTDAAGLTLRQAVAIATAIKSESKAAVQTRIETLASQQQVEKQIAALKAKLDADPKDAASRQELVRLYLVELDNPAEAAKFLDETLDEATRKYVPAAAKPVEEAPEVACTELGDWYKGLADQATTPASKGAMLRRAQAYYQRFLVLHTAADLGRTAATLTLKRIDDALAKLVPAPEPKSSPASLTLDLGKGVTMKLVLIPAGKFMMGSPDSEQGHRGNEGPQHEVIITKPFYMGVTEVTQAQYEAVMGMNPSKFKGPTNPVEMVSWEEAVEFCRKLSEKTGKTLRLPTEAEWEYACRAGTKTRFSFGDSASALGDYAWYGSNSGNKTHPVGQKKPNAWGLYDMHGNVWEWCADWYGSYPSGSLTDPQGPGSGSLRVVRGGSWRLNVTDDFRCAYRDDLGPPFRLGIHGFRCAGTRIEDAPGKLVPAPEPKSSPAGLTLDLGKGVAMTLVLIPPGKFVMGSPDSEQGRSPDEGPQHEVIISKPFYMGVTEVTQAQYEAVMGTNPSNIKGETNPVEMVSWTDATEFCKKLSEKTRQAVRLPTEAEWEYACRAGSKTRFSFGDSDSVLGDYAWYKSNSGDKTHPVGQKKPNAWGLYDMHGNVWEWCQDFHGGYAAGAGRDPAGPGSGTHRVLRGGSWFTIPVICRSAHRNYIRPDNRHYLCGFRVVVSVSAPGL